MEERFVYCLTLKFGVVRTGEIKNATEHGNTASLQSQRPTNRQSNPTTVSNQQWLI
jgi:hypothetical protein